ncbi:MAG: NifU family protein, partial [Pyrinomonadaceae bacterium]
MHEDRDFQTRMQHVEGLIRKIENLPDAEARASALELVQSLMDFHGAGLDRLMEIVAEEGEAGYRIFDNFASDDLVGSLLLLYGLHPVPLETRVMQALDKVRPYLDSHGGNVELIGISTDGIVRLRLQGSCKSCPSSSMTLKLAIEEAIMAAAPDVAAIEAEGVSEQPAPASGFVQIGKTQGNGNAKQTAGGNGWEEV